MDTEQKTHKAPYQVFFNAKGLGLEERTGEGRNVHQVARRDLERYYTLLAESAKHALNEHDLRVVAQAVRGWTPDATSTLLLKARVESFLVGTGKAETPASRQLLAFLGAVSPAGTLFLLDQAERYNVAHNSGRV